MLSFSTEFPVTGDCTADDFLEVIKSWTIDSPHTKFAVDDLAVLSAEGEQTVKKGDERIHCVKVLSEEEQLVAIQRTNSEEHIDWVTTIVFSGRKIDNWVGVRTDRESNRPAAVLPPAKKPIIVRNLLDRFGGAPDGTLPITREPFFLRDDDIVLASRLITGVSDCYLPIVYVSSSFVGSYIVDLNSLASDLSGLAHVVVEPNRPFSRRLQIEVDSENVYGGTVGIYWPDGGGRRSFFIGEQFENSSDIKRAIVDEIRLALMNRRPLPRCTWAAALEALSKTRFNELKLSGSRDLDEYVGVFDAEIKAKDGRLADAENEIARLRAEVRKYETRSAAGTELPLRTGGEQDLYAGEISEIVRDAIEDAAGRVQKDSRREHVLRAVIAATSADDVAKSKRDDLKSLLREYRTMDRRTRKGLEDLGFSIQEDGKHFKLIFGDDDRYTFALPKSGSDRRGGLNAASDISKRLF
jgi:hypothetical protein